jgi:hypothetical protein
MHTKGGGLYDEAVNVPLYVSWPSQRTTYSSTDGSTQVNRDYLVSGVDLFPFFLALGTGSESWRTAGSRYGYLAGRESIADMTYFSGVDYHRKVQLANGAYLQYVLHTTDEYDPSQTSFYPSDPAISISNAADASIPQHAICFRTSGLTVGVTEQKKLGIYSFWALCPSSAPTQPPVALGTPSDQSQYEFYDLTTPGETTNTAVLSYNSSTANTTLTTDASDHLGYFTSIAPAELYAVPSVYSSVYATALSAFLSAFSGTSC